MKGLKIVGNIFGIIFAVVFSIALVLVLVAIPPVKSFSSIFQADTIQNMVTGVMSAGVIEPGSAMAEGLEEAGISEDIVQDLMESDAVEDMLEVYLGDVLEATKGEDIESSLTMDVLEDIVKDNKKELIPLIEEYADVDDEDEAEELLDMLVEEHGEEIIEMLPSVEDTKITLSVSDNEGLFSEGSILRGLFGGTVIWVLIGVAVVLCLLIFLCRGFKLQGFVWLGVSFGVAAVLSVFVILLATNLSKIAGVGSSEMESIMLNAIVPGLTGVIVTGTLVIAALAVVFIAVYLVGKKVMGKKAQTV